jgi:hypothetical protein
MSASKLIIELNLDNCAMQDTNELARILSDISSLIPDAGYQPHHKKVYDINGNCVGYWEFCNEDLD